MDGLLGRKSQKDRREAGGKRAETTVVLYSKPASLRRKRLAMAQANALLPDGPAAALSVA